MNNRSANSAARGVFNVEVAPLLNLAGMAVDVIEARERGQTKEIARTLATNGLSGVVVVGDDGTMQVCYWLIAVEIPD
jgi:diacylglycerol kinase family enzyme